MTLFIVFYYYGLVALQLHSITYLVQEYRAALFNEVHVYLKGCSAICIDLNRSQIREAFDELGQKQRK